MLSFHVKFSCESGDFETPLTREATAAVLRRLADRIIERRMFVIRDSSGNKIGNAFWEGQ